MELQTEKKLETIYDLSKTLSDDEMFERKDDIVNNKSKIKYHYAPLETVFKILETDSIRLTNSRFSNDESEEKMLDSKNKKIKEYNADNYIFCVCDEGDQLSQWRGYCPNGGASIGLSVDDIKGYSILFANSDIECVSSVNRAIPVVYADSKDCETTYKRIESKLKEAEFDGKIDIEDIIPYIKNDRFYEEKESRIVFSNIDKEYDNCIRFRETENKILVPYILVKFGHAEKNIVSVKFDFSDKAIEEFIKNRSNPVEIMIPQGSNQEKIYQTVKQKYIKMRNEDRFANPNMYIFCEGHLPVKKIFVAPTYDRDRTAESIKRFCKSRYWLSEVEVEASNIPFIPPIR